MRRFSLLLFGLVIILAAFSSNGFSAARSAPASEKGLVILHTSDEHSHLLGVGPESEDYPLSPFPGASAYLKGGIARRATIFKQLRSLAAAKGAAVLTLSSGDNLMGTLAHVASMGTAPDYTAMILLGYDAITFGNHDFEIGPIFLAKTLQAAQKSGKLFPIVASNIKFSQDPKQADALLYSMMDETGKDLSKPIRRWQVITTANGIRVGLAGVMGVNASHYAPGKRPIQFSCSAQDELDPAKYDACMAALYQDLQKVVDGLRNKQKADVVIVMGHTGTDPVNPANGESYKIAQNVSGIDLFLSGHTHLLVPYQTAKNLKTGKLVPITEPGAFGENVSMISLIIDKNGQVKYDPENSMVVPVTNGFAADRKMQPVVDGAIKYLETVEDVPGGNSFLKRSLSDILAAPVKYDNALGSLYFYSLGKTKFDVVQAFQARETPMLRLVADAFLWQAMKQDPNTEIALSASGYTRDSLWKGQKGMVSLADVFRVLPLGISPTDGTLGHPLAVVGLTREEMKIFLELTPSMAYESEKEVDYYTLPAGICAEFDTGRPLFSRITKIKKSAGDNDNCLSEGALIYDASDTTDGGWMVPADKIFVTALDFYHVALGIPVLSAAFGVKLRTPDGNPIPLNEAYKVVVKRPDGNEVKNFEALASYLKAQCDINNGYLPGSYADPLPHRTLCKGPLCGQ